VAARASPNASPNVFLADDGMGISGCAVALSKRKRGAGVDEATVLSACDSLAIPSERDLAWQDLIEPLNAVG
jgi:hypothetical protein